MDRDRLRIFHAVVEAGSFTKAGRAFDLSQSAISRHDASRRCGIFCSIRRAGRAPSGSLFPMTRSADMRRRRLIGYFGKARYLIDFMAPRDGLEPPT